MDISKDEFEKLPTQKQTSRMNWVSLVNDLKGQILTTTEIEELTKNYTNDGTPMSHVRVLNYLKQLLRQKKVQRRFYGNKSVWLFL